MMDNNRNNKLIDHIRQSLQEHEEPYAAGAWESFQQHRKSTKKKGTSAWMIALGTAASLLLLISLPFLIEKYAPSNTDTPIAGYKQQDEGKSKLPAAPDSHTSEKKSPSRQTKVTAHSQAANTRADSPVAAASIELEDRPTAAMSPVASARPRKLDPVLITGEAPPGSGDLQPAASRGGGEARYHIKSVQQNAPATQRVIDKRIQGSQAGSVRFGLTYAPLINSNSSGAEWSMGGGFHTEWSFARGFALSSGVLLAQNQLEFNQESPSRIVGAEQAGSAYLQANLLSMEVPLSLQYSLTDNISVSAGISSLAYLKEQYDYTYEFEREIQVMTFEETSGYEPVTTAVTITETEQQSEGSFNAIDWAGFYTFSVSYKHDLSDNYTLALEPFMKLPTGPLTSRELKYYTGGLQMKVSF